MVKFYPSWFVFFLLTLIGLSFVLSSGNWFMVWMGLEFTLMGFLPMFSVSSLVVESMIKYFFVQAGGSVLFIFSFLLSDCSFTMFFYLASMFLKLGLFPFFYWVPVVMSSMSWMGCLILVTFQKLGPMFLLFSSVSGGSFFVILSGAFSIVMSGLLGYNQSMMRPLLAYSSISHTGWVVSVSVVNISVGLLYVLVYFFLTFILFVFLEFSNSRSVLFSGLMGMDKFSVGFSMMVLVGMPPFSLFYLKVMVFFSLALYPVIIVLMTFGTFFSSYFYLSYFIPSLMKPFFQGWTVSKGMFFLFFTSLFIPLMCLF